MQLSDSEFTLNVGGRYRVKVPDEDDTEGIFRGYCAVGGDSAVVMELEGGMMRFIPVPQIVMIDVLEPGVTDTGKRVRSDVNYG